MRSEMEKRLNKMGREFKKIWYKTKFYNSTENCEKTVFFF